LESGIVDGLARFWNPLLAQQRIGIDLHALCASREPGLASRMRMAL